MGNELKFSLGLTVGSFLGAATKAEDKIRELTSSFLGTAGLGAAIGGAIAAVSSFENVMEGLAGAIERGASLEHLSKQTGESASELYQLQEGFRAVGLSTDEVGSSIFRMQKALGGVNEYGEDTRSIFYRMGLDINQLKRLDVPQQFAAISRALGQLNSSGAANAASTIFGREGAQNMVLLSRSTSEFSQALSDSAHEAQVFGENAASFEHLQISLDQFKMKTQTLFAGMAAGAAPAIQAVVDMLNKIDLSKLGNEIGNVFTAFTEAFREGKVTELLALSVRTGFKLGLDAFLYSIPAAFEYLGAVLLKAFQTPLEYLQAGMTWVIEKLMEGLGKIPKLNKMLGLDGFKADSFGDIMTEEKKTGPQFDLGTGQFGIDDIQQDASDRWKAGLDAFKQDVAPLGGMIKGLVARAPKPRQDEKNKSGNGLDLATTNGHYKPEADVFEKMGFVMNGANNVMQDYARRTALAVERLAGGQNPNTAAQPSIGSGAVNLN